MSPRVLTPRPWAGGLCRKSVLSRNVRWREAEAGLRSEERLPREVMHRRHWLPRTPALRHSPPFPRVPRVHCENHPTPPSRCLLPQYILQIRKPGPKGRHKYSQSSSLEDDDWHVFLPAQIHLKSETPESVLPGLLWSLADTSRASKTRESLRGRWNGGGGKRWLLASTLRL